MLRACYRHAANALTVHPRVQMLILTSALLQTGTTCEETSGTNLEMAQRMEQERLAILEHPVVRSISDVDRLKGGRPGFRVSLWCQTAQQNGHGECDCGGLRQGVPVCVSSKRTTLLLCLQDLHKQVLNQHGPNCNAACTALAAQRNDSSAGAPDAFRLMMDLNKAKKSLDEAVSELKSMKERADKVNKESLKLQKLVEGAEKTRHEAEKEVILLQAQLNPKRARIDADVLEEDEIENVGDWTLADHRREASLVCRIVGMKSSALGTRPQIIELEAWAICSILVWDSWDGCHIGHEVIKTRLSS